MTQWLREEPAGDRTRRGDEILDASLADDAPAARACARSEVEQVVRHLKTLGAPDYDDGILDGPDADTEDDLDLVLGLGGNTQSDDALYDQAVAIVAKDRKCSTSYIQRKLGVGYNKAAKLVEQMEEQGVVSQANHVGKREVLVPER